MPVVGVSKFRTGKPWKAELVTTLVTLLFVAFASPAWLTVATMVKPPGALKLAVVGKLKVTVAPGAIGPGIVPLTTVPPLITYVTGILLCGAVPELVTEMVITSAADKPQTEFGEVIAFITISTVLFMNSNAPGSGAVVLRGLPRISVSTVGSGAPMPLITALVGVKSP